MDDYRIKQVNGKKFHYYKEELRIIKHKFIIALEKMIFWEQIQLLENDDNRNNSVRLYDLSKVMTSYQVRVIKIQVRVSKLIIVL